MIEELHGSRQVGLQVNEKMTSVTSRVSIFFYYIFILLLFIYLFELAPVEQTVIQEVAQESRTKIKTWSDCTKNPFLETIKIWNYIKVDKIAKGLREQTKVVDIIKAMLQSRNGIGQDTFVEDWTTNGKRLKELEMNDYKRLKGRNQERNQEVYRRLTQKQKVEPQDEN